MDIGAFAQPNREASMTASAHCARRGDASLRYRKKMMRACWTRHGERARHELQAPEPGCIQPHTLRLPSLYLLLPHRLPRPSPPLRQRHACPPSALHLPARRPGPPRSLPPPPRHILLLQFILTRSFLASAHGHYGPWPPCASCTRREDIPKDACKAEGPDQQIRPQREGHRSVSLPCFHLTLLLKHPPCRPPSLSSQLSRRQRAMASLHHL